MADPWEKLGTDDAQRVEIDGRYDFFWVVLETGAPGLMLRLQAVPEPHPKLPKLKNLVAAFRPVGHGRAFVLGLKERSQLEVFETLCRDVVAAGEAAEDVEDALNRAIRRTMRWHHLLRGGRTSGLSVEEQRGLVGELAFLRDLVEGLGPQAAIEAWTGPTGSAKDFELIGTCVEVKTRRVAAKPFVSISSEDQLSDVEESRLFLRVANVASAVIPDGLDLHDHVRMTARLFRDSGSASDTWEDVLFSTGYDPDEEYDGRRWQLGTASHFEVTEGFPRVATPLPPGVEAVRYSIGLDACAPFAFDADLIDTIREGLSIE